MNENQNTLLSVASLSIRLAGKYMQPYSCSKSPHKFTQSQLMACLVLRAYLKTTYRGIIDLLGVSEELRSRLGLKKLPHHSTLKYFSDPLKYAANRRCFAFRIVTVSCRRQGDSTGLEATSASSYFQARSGRKQKKYVKLSVCILCASLIPTSVVLGWGPCNDKSNACALLVKSHAAIQPERLYADAGYDAEWVHEFCREKWKVKSFIPPAVHRRNGTLGGKYRSQMTPERLKRNHYSRRWTVESFMSALKRTTGSMLLARKPEALLVESAVRVLAYAIKR